VAWSYSVKEGIANLNRSKFAALASTSAATVALILVGLLGLVGYEAQQVSSWLLQRVGEVEIFLEEGIDGDNAEALYRRAGLTPGVADADYVSQEEAQAIFLEEFGEGGEAFLDDPFLPASIRVRVDSDYANADSLNALVQTFSGWNRVDDVVFNQPLLVQVQQNVQTFTIVGAMLGGLVLLAAIFLVANTIRLTIYSRRLLIRTMKLVGATDGFIRRPFLIEGMLQGATAGAVAGVVLLLLHGVLSRYLPQLGTLTVEVSALMVGGLVVFGVVLGWIGSYVAVRRFIRKVALH